MSMKNKKLVAILFAMCGANLYMAADSIVKKNGEIIQCQNIEVTDKYVLYNNVGDEALCKISTGEVFGVQIGDKPMASLSEFGTGGDADKPQKQDAADEEAGGNLPKYVEPVPSGNNAAYIQQYNNQSISRKGKKPNGKDSEWFLALWSITGNSILSDENVEISFERQTTKYDYLLDPFDYCCYKIKVTNKTAQSIYVDLANSFKVRYNGEAVPYFTNSTYSTSSGKVSGASMNLGAITGAVGIGGALGTLASGINVGGGSAGQASITTAEQQILVIPAFSSAFLPGTKELSGKDIKEIQDTYSFVNREKEAEFPQTFKNLRSLKEDIPGNAHDLNIRQWETTKFGYEESPKRIKRIVTYSTRPDFKTYTCLPIELYLSSVFGSPSRHDSLKNFEFTDLQHAIFGIGYTGKK